MNSTNQDTIKHDIVQIKNALFKLSVPSYIKRAITIILSIVVWIFLAQYIYQYGMTQNYEGFNAFSVQMVNFLQSVNVYIWWFVILLGSLVLFFILSNWLENDLERLNKSYANADLLRTLLPSLSNQSKDVLIWVWNKRAEPITVGNLRTTLVELKKERANKIALVREQANLLGIPSETPELEFNQPALHAEPSLDNTLVPSNTSSINERNEPRLPNS